MVANPTVCSAFPPDMVDAVRRDAERDADSAAQLLDELGLGRQQPSDPPVALPAQLLLGLGMAMRLLSWEAQGINLHRVAGLPRGEEILKCLLRSAVGDEADGGPALTQELWVCILRLSVEHLAWQGPELMGADVEIGPVDEECLIEALAELAWSGRHGGGR
jgi:hypothetical protein